MRLRFAQRELALLKGAEQVHGDALAHMPRPDQLRTALNLAKAGYKLGHAEAGTSISLEEGELHLLLDALRYATDAVKRTTRPPENGRDDAHRREAVLAAFPELVERGAWRSFGLIRELDALATRLEQAANHR